MDSTVKSDGLYFFRRNALFGPLGEEVLEELVTALKSKMLGHHDVLVRAGDAGDGLYMIRAGRARIVSHAENGEEKTIAYLGRGDTVGEMALLTSEPHGYEVITDTPCEFLILAKADFDAMLDKHPLVAIHLSRAITKRLAVAFHPSQDKPRRPQIIALVPALPHEAIVLYTINMAIALVEQTRRRVLLVDLYPRNGDLARALNLPPPPVSMESLSDEDLLDLNHLHQQIRQHASGLELLSIPPQLIKGHLLDDIPPLLNLLKDHYDFILVLAPLEENAISPIVLPEAEKAMLISWDQAPELTGLIFSAYHQNLGTHPLPEFKIHLQHPTTAVLEPADFRIPWTESLHLPFRESGNPYLNGAGASETLAGMDRIARALGHLRVGVAMGSGAAYGYAIIGLLKVFEREGIPIDLVAGTSMGALLGSLFCSGLSPEKVADAARGITKNWLRKNMLADLRFPRSGFLGGETLHAFLRGILGRVEFHQMPIPFEAVATDIRTGNEVVLREGRVVDAVRASTSLPVIFQPFLHQGHYLVDGGLVNPVPTSTVAKMGADILISMNLTAKPSMRRAANRKTIGFPLAPRSPGLTEIIFKMIYTMQYEIAQARTEIAHVVIAPDMKDFMWTDFHRSDEILKVGEAAAEQAVAKIKSLLPYFAHACQVPIGPQRRAW
jgi:NTE family protein